MGLLADWTVKINVQGAQDATKGVAGVKEQMTIAQQVADGFYKILGNIGKAFAPVAVAAFVLKKAMESKEGAALLEVFSQIGDILARLITPIIGLIASAMQRWIPILKSVVALLSPIIDFLVRFLDIVFKIGEQMFEYMLLPITKLIGLIGELTGIKLEFDPIKKSGSKGKAGGAEDPTAIFGRIQDIILSKESPLAVLKDIRKFSKNIDFYTGETAVQVGKLKPGVAK